jgi:DinB superfamily
LDRQQLLNRLGKAWREFQNSHAGLSEAELLEPGVTGCWSVRDILAHVTTWEEEALAHLPLVLSGGTPPRYSVTYGGIDAFNARMTEAKRGLSLEEVTRRMHEVHGKLLGFLAGVPEDQFRSETRFRRRLRLDTYSHYPKHGRAIERWRERTLFPAPGRHARP